MDKVQETKSHSKKQNDETEALCRYEMQHRREYTMSEGQKSKLVRQHSLILSTTLHYWKVVRDVISSTLSLSNTESVTYN